MKLRTPTSTAWMAYAAICLMSIMWVGIQWNCMNLYAAPVVEDLGISRTQFMVALSIPGILSAAVSLTCFGTIEQRVGLRRMLLIGGILNTLAFVTWALMDSAWMLYLGGVLYGCGCSITAYNSVAAGVNRWFKQRMGMLMGAANTMGNVAGIVFALVIAAVIAAVGWRYSFALCIGLSAISTVVCVLLYKGNPEDLGMTPLYANEGSTAGNADGDLPVNGAITEASADNHLESAREASNTDIPYRQALRTPRMWLLCLGYLLMGAITYALMGTLPLFTLDLGYGDLQGQAVSASLFAMSVMMVPLGIVCDRVGTKWAITLTAALAAAASILLCQASLPFAGVLAAAAFTGAAYSACGVTVGVGVKEAFGETEFSKKLGICSGFSYLGLAMGPGVTNLVYDLTGTYATILAVYVALCAVMAACFFIALRTKSNQL